MFRRNSESTARHLDSSPLTVIQGSRRNNRSISPFILIGIVIIEGIAFAKRGYKDVVVQDLEGNPQISSERKAEAERAKDKLDKAEVYYLLANANQMIECYLCPEGQMRVN